MNSLKLSEANDAAIHAWMVSIGIDANEIPKGVTRMPWPWDGTGSPGRAEPEWYDDRLAWLVAELRCSQPDTQTVMYPFMLQQYGELAVKLHDLAVGCGDPDGADALRASKGSKC